MAGFMYNVGVVFSGKNMVSPALNRMSKDAAESALRMSVLSRNIKGALGMLPGARMGFGGFLGASAALYGIQAGIRGIISESSRFEVANVQFTNLLGSVELARQKLVELRDFAATTPFEFKYSQELSKGLLAANVAADDLVPTLRMLGDLGMGDVEKIGQLANAYVKVKMVGRATWRELRMFATAGVPIFAELQKVIGTNQLGLEKMSRQGKISFDLMESALKSLTSEGSKFNGMMTRMMDTVPGMWSNFRENVDKVSQQFGGVFQNSLKMLIMNLTVLTSRISDWITQNEQLIAQGMDRFFNRISIVIANLDVDKILNFLTGMIKGFSTLLTVLVGYKILIGTISLLAGVLQVLSGVAMLTGVSMAVAFWPVLGILAAILAAAFAVGWVLKKAFGFSLTGGITEGLKSYGELFRQTTGQELTQGPVSLEGQNSVRNSEQTINRNNNSTATLNIATAPGTTASLDRDIPGINLMNYSFGNQLRGSANA